MSGSCCAVWLCTDLHIGNECDNRQFGHVNQIVITPNADSALVMTASAPGSRIETIPLLPHIVERWQAERRGLERDELYVNLGCLR
jgi:hypothetical protein